MEYLIYQVYLMARAFRADRGTRVCVVTGLYLVEEAMGSTCPSKV